MTENAGLRYIKRGHGKHLLSVVITYLLSFRSQRKSLGAGCAEGFSHFQRASVIARRSERSTS
nr:MAG TPA: hypothetical protein [Bacteriophage sp.]